MFSCRVYLSNVSTVEGAPGVDPVFWTLFSLEDIWPRLGPIAI